MFTLKRQVELLVAPNDSAYLQINQSKSQPSDKYISASVTPKNKLITKTNILRNILPGVLGIDINNPQWASKVSEYFDSYNRRMQTITVLDIGFVYNSKEVADEFKAREDKLQKALESELIKNKDSKYRKNAYDNYYNYLLDLEDEKCEMLATGLPKYGRPENNRDYFTWIYCLFYSRVANREEFIGVSSRITFFLQDPVDVEARKTRARGLSKEAMSIFVTKVQDNPKMVNNMFYLLADDTVKKSDLDIGDKEDFLRGFSTNSPKLFLSAYKDKHLQSKAEIEQMIAFGLLSRIGDSSIIVLSEDKAYSVGATTLEAVAFLNNPTENTKSIISGLRHKLSSLLSPKTLGYNDPDKESE